MTPNWGGALDIGLSKMKTGIDVSENQYLLDWLKVKLARAQFVIIRVSYGVTLDQKFLQHLAGALAAGLEVGVYHYVVKGSVCPISAQVDFFYNQIKTLVENHVIFMEAGDLERPDAIHPGPTAEDSRIFHDGLSQRTGRAPWLYTSAGYWNSLYKPEWGALYPLWLAAYRSSWPDTIEPWVWWSAWQKDSKGKIAGSSGSPAGQFNPNVDRDIIL
jgi:lysozyme